MNKQEFIDKLRAALNGRISTGLVEENARYYTDYIDTEIRKGRGEEEVLASLGDPRLIAKSIIQANGGTNGGYTETVYGSGEYRDADSRDRDYDDSETYSESKFRRTIHRLPLWVWILLWFVVLVVLIGVVLSVLSFLAPVLIPILVVLFLVKLFRDWMN